MNNVAITQKEEPRMSKRQASGSGIVGTVYTTRFGKKKAGVAESCKGVTAWKQVKPSQREEVHYGIIPPHQ